MRLQAQLELALIQNSTSIADHENIRDTRLFKKSGFAFKLTAYLIKTLHIEN